jgi:tetratricopeptide (TPR) repeat protein
MTKSWCAGLLVLVACAQGGAGERAAPTAPAAGTAPTCDADAPGPEAAFERGAALAEPYFMLSDRPPAERPEKELDLRTAIACFEQVVQVAPASWAALWLKGKAYQALGEHVASVAAFRAAYQYEQDNPNVGRELAFALMETGAHAEAVTIAGEVAERHAEDAGLVSNLALALLLDAQIERAREVVERAHQLDPADPITAALRQAIDDVASGRRPQPVSLRELEKR